MNAQHFDTLARRLGAAIPRRPLIAAMAATLFTTLESPQVALACKKVGKRCDKNKDCCNGAKCKGGKHGKCKCKSGFAKCDKQCYDLDADRRHCGSCDQSCGTNELCIDGACITPDGCPGGADFCSGEGPAIACGTGDCVCAQSTEGETVCAQEIAEAACGQCDTSADCASFGPDAFCVSTGSTVCCGPTLQNVCYVRCPA